MNILSWLFVAAVSVVAQTADLYKVLGVSRSASEQEIKKAYKSLSKKYHPDISKEADATEKFQQVAQAYEILGDEEQRRIYDKHGIEGIRRNQQGGPPGGHEGGFPFEFRGGSPFEQLFRGGGHHQQQQRGPANITKPLPLTLETLYHGEELEVTLSRPVVCPEYHKCVSDRPDCAGQGVKVITQKLGPGMTITQQSADPNCIAKGKALRVSSKCKVCPKGVVYDETSTLNVSIKPGSKAGDTMSFEGYGPQEIGQEPGDLVIQIVEDKSRGHHNLTRKGNDLYANMNINIVDALTGFEKNIPHFSGEVKVKTDNVTPDGKSIKLVGKGMPVKGTKRFGDLYIVPTVKYPTSIAKETRDKLREAFSSDSRLKSEL